MLGNLSSILIPGIGEQHLLFASLIIESGKNCPPVTGHSWYTLKRDFMGFPQPWRKQQCQQCQQVTAWVTANLELRLAGPAFSGDLVASFRRPPGLWGPGVYWTSWTPQNMAVFICFHGEMIKNFLDLGGSKNISHIRKTRQVSAPFLSALQGSPVGQLWPATPESTPPTSPRSGVTQGGSTGGSEN